MSASDDYLDYLRDRLSVLGSVTFRKMFGGAGVYFNGLIFGIVAEDALFLKVDDDNRADYEALGIPPFKPFDDKPTTMSYYEIPADVLEDDAQLKNWADKAYGAALRADAKKKLRGKKAGTKRRHKS